MKMPINDNLIISAETMPVISQLAESIPGGFFIYYAEGTQELIYFNSHLAEIFGCADAEEFRQHTGNSFRGMVHPEDYDGNEREIREQVRRDPRRNDHVRYRFIRRNGSVGMMDDYGHFSHSDTFGDIYYVFVQDITRQYREEQAQRELISTFSGHYEAALLGETADGKYSVVSGAEKLNGFFDGKDTLDAALLKYISQAVYPPDREKLEKKLLSSDGRINMPAAGEQYASEYRREKDGRNIWYRLTVRRFRPERILIGFENCDRDYTRRIINEKLMGEYDGIYLADLERGRIRPVKVSSASGNRTGVEMDYTQAVRALADRVEAKYRQDWLNFSDREYMQRYLQRGDHREYVYELPGEGNRMRRFTADVLERDTLGAARVALHSFAAIDDDRAAVMRLDRQLAEHRKLLEYFVDQYWSACFIDLANDRLEIIRANNANTGAYVMDGSRADMARFIDSHFHPDDRALMHRICDKDHVRKELRDKASVSYMAREIIDGEERTMRILIVRGADEDHVAVGFMDVTHEVREQQARLLGAVPLSPDILAKANIGLWAFEMDEGQPPRMYADRTMLGLLGLANQVPPEDIYHAWYDHIDKGSYELVADAVSKMAAGEHAEVQYPWHCPDGRTIIVRCGGVRNPGYTKGVRIEGTHQDVTQTLHFDEKAARKRQLELEAAEVRAEMLAFISDHEPDVDRFMDFFGERVIRTLGCDQFIFRGTDGHRVVVNAAGISDIPGDICEGCPALTFDRDDWGIGGTLRLDDRAAGKILHPGCPAKSSYMQKVYCGDNLAGLLTVHYLREKHTFTENDIDILTTVRTHLGLLLMRIGAKKAELERFRAESANAAKTEFLFNMSHDIRTPMNAIIGFANIAKKEIDNPEKAKACLDKVLLSGDILLNLINEVLDMSRIESGKAELHEEKQEIGRIFERFEPAMAGLAAAKDIDLTFRAGPVRDNGIYADGPRLDRMLINIISNAIKYTPAEGCVKVTVEQTADTVNGRGRYLFTVADNGIGMSAEFQQHMYENFSREFNPVTNAVPGTGLGLALAKKLTDMMGGTIGCVSALGKGTTFTIEIPFRTWSGAGTADISAGTEAGQTISLKGKKALLAEDNELNRELACDILEDEGVTVETAVDGRLAVERVLTRGEDYYDFILMDIRMPVMDGYEATRMIRHLLPGLRAPIIAVSANAFEEDRRKSREAGMDDHVAKPINVRTLFRTLEKVAAGRRDG